MSGFSSACAARAQPRGALKMAHRISSYYFAYTILGVLRASLLSNSRNFLLSSQLKLQITLSCLGAGISYEPGDSPLCLLWQEIAAV